MPLETPGEYCTLLKIYKLFHNATRSIIYALYRITSIRALYIE